MEHEQPINAYVCQYCKGSFDKLENLSKHVQKIHTVSSSGKENRICPLCGTQCVKIDGYRNHLRHIHGHNEDGQVVLFKSFNDFLVWKNELEKRNYCKYVLKDPPKKLPSNDRIHIYQCDSSVRSMKEKKSGVAVRESCPAVITAIESAKTKGVKIEHWNRHVGHIIPVEDVELDAAIGSLGTAEIVLTSDQRYQYEGQSADGNIFFITESNDGSLSETFVKESPKKSNLFQNTKAKVSANSSKPTTQKFSYKKDPTKKSGSFNYSLASVACMKPSAKKKILIPPAVATTCSVEDSGNTTVTDSVALFPEDMSSVASSEVELATQSISDAMNADISPKNDIPVDAKEKETPVTHATPSKSVSITNQTFEFLNEGSLSGQVVVLNSVPGQDGSQNFILSPDQKVISISPAINVGTVSPKKGKGSKKSQKNIAASQIIVIPTASEKENVASVQNCLNNSENSIPFMPVIKDPNAIIIRSPHELAAKSPDLVVKKPQDFIAKCKNSPGPSILKKAKKSVQRKKICAPPKKTSALPKKTIRSIINTIKLAPKKTVSSLNKPVSTKQKLSLGLNPSLDVTVVDASDLTPSATSSSAENVKVTISSTLEVINTPLNTSSSSSNFVSTAEDTITSCPTIINNSALSAIKNLISSVSQSCVSSAPQYSVPTAAINSVSSSAPICASSVAQNSFPSTVKPVNPVLFNSFPPGQTFMSINNNLIPIGTPTATMLPSSFGPGFVLATPIPPSPVTRPMMTYSHLASRLPVTSSICPAGSSETRPQNKQTSIGSTACQKTPPHTSTARQKTPPHTSTARQKTPPHTSTARQKTPPHTSTARQKTPPHTSTARQKTPPYTSARRRTPPYTYTPRPKTYTYTARQKTLPQTSTAPVVLIPNSGSQIGPSVPFSSPFMASSVISTLSSSIGPTRTPPIVSNSISSSSVLPRPLISNSGTSIYAQLPPGAQIISTPIIPGVPTPILSNNVQRISRPILRNFPLLAGPGKQVPRSILQSISFPAPLIGQPPIVPVGPRAIISTTISNAIKVQKVQLPFSKTTVTSPCVTLASIAGVTTSLSESTNVSSVVLNTEPISSAPAISIPQLASIGSHKPGSVIFESQGDMYMLEPVEENTQVNNNTSARNAPNKLSIAVPSVNGNTKTIESASEGNKNNLSCLLKEKAADSTSETRADGRVKSLSPKKNTDIKNGVQIKSVVQEKRHLKDDDVEILKKVKYYQMEMKYLASQAECKRLKLELARAQIKNKEIVKSNTDPLSSEISLRENADEDALHVDSTSEKGNLELKETSNTDVAENKSMDIDDASHELSDKTTEHQFTSDQTIDDSESANQCNADLDESNHSSAESGDYNCADNSPVDSENSNHSEIADPSLKEDQTKDSLDSQNSDDDEESMNCDIESDEISNLETQKEAHSALNEESQNIEAPESESNNSYSFDQSSKTDSNEEIKDVNKSEPLNIIDSENKLQQIADELMDFSQIKDVNKSEPLNINNAENKLQQIADDIMDFSQIEENLKNVNEDNKTVNDSESGDPLDIQDLGAKEKSNLDDEIHSVQHSEFSQQKTINEEDFMDLDDKINSSFQSEKVDLPCDKTQFQETLKVLELQYGEDESSDIYTMIRTSVLRSLYDDMKTLCEENKKLYEKLQKCRSQEESSDSDKLDS